jgi:hypothetical protein
MKSFLEKFESSLQTKRILKARNYADCLRNAPGQIMRAKDAYLPDIVFEDEDETYFRTSSYARTPGVGVGAIESALKNTLPGDFVEFHNKFSEALVVTRSYPLHIWDSGKILEWLGKMRYEKNYPLRFIRFGDYWDLEARQFGLWQRTPYLSEWCVVATSVEDIDDYYDNPTYSDYNKLGDSFSGWLENWIDRDGLPDPFMKLGVTGGFLDPINKKDSKRIGLREA